MNEKISQLPSYSNPQPNDLLPIVNVATGTTSAIKYSAFQSGQITIYNDTVTGTIDGSNTLFSVPNGITSAIILILGNSSYQAGVDYTFSGKNITFGEAPSITLSGQPFFCVHT